MDPLVVLSWSVYALLGKSTDAKLVNAARALVAFDWNRLVLPLLVSRAGGVTADMFECARFLLLCVHTGGSESLSPPATVDAVWHDLLLNTKVYATLCADMGGGAIHHNPFRAHDGGRAARRTHTNRLYHEVFGVAPPTGIWLEGLPAGPAPASSEHGTKRARTSITLYFKMLTGKTLTIDVAPEHTMSDVKEELETQYDGFSTDDVRFIHNGVNLDDDDKQLESYGITHESTIQVVRPRVPRRSHAC